MRLNGIILNDVKESYLFYQTTTEDKVIAIMYVLYKLQASSTKSCTKKTETNYKGSIKSVFSLQSSRQVVVVSSQ